MTASPSLRLSKRLLDPNLLFSLLTQMANKAPALMTATILTRVYATEVMGDFFFATALSFFVSMIASFGTNLHLVRAVAAQPHQGLEQLGEVLGLRLSSAVIAFFLLNGSIWVVAPELLMMMTMTSLHFLLGDLSHSFGAFLIGMQRFRLRLFLSLTGPVFLMGSVALTVLFNANFIYTLLCYVLASVIMLTMSYIIVRMKFGLIPISLHWQVLRRISYLCWPLLMIETLQIVQFKIDTLMIFSMLSATAVAEYETAYRLLEVTRLAVRPLAVVAFPLCVTYATQQRWGDVNQLLWRTVLLAAALGGLFALVVTPRPDLIMGIIWGDAYRQSGPILRVLFLTAPLLLAGVVWASLANAVHLERTLMLIMAMATVLNLTLNFWAIPIWGAVGAAWTTLATEAFILTILSLTWVRTFSTRASNSRTTVGQ
ncbi:MAG: oligosaccharide flippase family protein [Nitrospirales bacterium]|nr:oligosaccharide flippase family protein [Nitrospira sp.]MDR4502196.1 oligosaccharide flippase family protein [Nitrospirales bacterium]